MLIEYALTLEQIYTFGKPCFRIASHSLRHTFASNLLEEGAEVISMKELLGHASMESSERYAKLSNQRVKQIYQHTIRKVIAKTRV